MRVLVNIEAPGLFRLYNNDEQRENKLRRIFITYQRPVESMIAKVPAALELDSHWTNWAKRTRKMGAEVGIGYSMSLDGGCVRPLQGPVMSIKHSVWSLEEL